MGPSKVAPGDAGRTGVAEDGDWVTWSLQTGVGLEPVLVRKRHPEMCTERSRLCGCRWGTRDPRVWRM